MTPPKVKPTDTTKSRPGLKNNNKKPAVSSPTAGQNWPPRPKGK